MNTAPLKSYAPAARQAFIAAVTAQAARLGITSKETAPATVQGDVLLVNGQAFPRSAESGRNKLVARVKAHGFEGTMDAVAYTWFNRLVAIRYMELHNYLDHGYRVLSDPSGSGRPEILDRATDVELPGLDRSRVIQLKLDGTKDEELYRLLLMAQCNALHKAMPFLFEKIGDETELLLPANLLHTDSLIRRLVEDIEESAWDQIEIIGWLYQFYISDKKAQVIGKVVKSEDIPAATQLFTPNWIVKYMVQNSLGAQWLATYPASPLKAQMEYYIEPAEQTKDVKAQLAAITPAALNTEEITLIDPACGSGHILVEAYDLFKAIYVERGYRERDAAQLILTKNLYGLDIDQRAAQLSGFALMMKGRADDRRFFERGVKLNVMAMVNSNDLNIAELIHEVKLADFNLEESDLRELKKLFEHATTFGSLIQVPESFATKLPSLRKLSEATVGEVRGQAGDMFAAAVLDRLGPLVRQAEVLATRYDNVVANPPYLGSGGMNEHLKGFAKAYFPDSQADLFAVAVERFENLLSPFGYFGFMIPFNWMFLKSYKALRLRMINRRSIRSLIQPELHAFFDSAYVSISTFVAHRFHSPRFKATFVNLSDFYGAEIQAEKAQEAIRKPDCGWLYRAIPEDFMKVPGSPIVFTINEQTLQMFDRYRALGETCKTRKGMATGRNAEFVRAWPEVSIGKTGLGMTRTQATTSGRKWFPYANGGRFRKWYGNYDDVVEWESDGSRLRSETNETGRVRAVNLNLDHIFNQGLSWTSITSGTFAIRYLPPGFLFSSASNALFCAQEDLLFNSLGFLNSKVHVAIAKLLNPTLNANPGDVSKIPLCECQDLAVSIVRRLVDLAKLDWDAYERSWDFRRLPLTSYILDGCLESSFCAWVADNEKMIADMQRLEEELNRLFIQAYGLQEELSSEVPVEQISVTVNPAFRYGVKGTDKERQAKFRDDTTQELISYAIGCMMGRYSLDEPGLIYAHSQNKDFDPSHYTIFAADTDGIIPITDFEWFEDDCAHRLSEFIAVVWGASRLEENLSFLAKNLDPLHAGTSRDCLRRYVREKFFGDHIRTDRYNKCPVYWLFSSGKEKAFQCLVYAHRYNEGTLARMRSEYVIPLQGKMAARLANLNEDLEVAASTAQRKRLEKESECLNNQYNELQAFDEKLRHYADRRITFDLDDGVKVNYGKFGSLLAEVATVHGQKAEGP